MKKGDEISVFLLGKGVLFEQAGTEQFDGTYYYAGAMAGELDMRNGPPGWEWIKYVRDSQCP